MARRRQRRTPLQLVSITWLLIPQLQKTWQARSASISHSSTQLSVKTQQAGDSKNVMRHALQRGRRGYYQLHAAITSTKHAAIFYALWRVRSLSAPCLAQALTFQTGPITIPYARRRRPREQNRSASQACSDALNTEQLHTFMAESLHSTRQGCCLVVVP